MNSLPFFLSSIVWRVGAFSPRFKIVILLRLVRRNKYSPEILPFGYMLLSIFTTPFAKDHEPNVPSFPFLVTEYIPLFEENPFLYWYISFLVGFNQ